MLPRPFGVACEQGYETLERSGVSLVERCNCVRVDIEYRDEPPGIVEYGYDDLRPGPSVTCDVTRKSRDIRDDQGAALHGCGAAYALTEGDLQTSERSLIGTDSKESVLLDHLIKARPQVTEAMMQHRDDCRHCRDPIIDPGQHVLKLLLEQRIGIGFRETPEIVGGFRHAVRVHAQ